MSRTTVPESATGSPGLGSPTVEQVMQALATVQDPESRRPITDLGMVKNVEAGSGGAVRVDGLLAGADGRKGDFEGKVKEGKRAAAAARADPAPAAAAVPGRCLLGRP